MSNVLRTVEVVNGPSKDGLKAALFDRERIRSPRRVEFTLKDGFQHEVVVTSVEAEDGSGESWNVRGHAYMKLPGAKTPPPPRHIQMYFHTGRRKGTLTFLD